MITISKACMEKSMRHKWLGKNYETLHKQCWLIYNQRRFQNLSRLSGNIHTNLKLRNLFLQALVFSPE